MQLNTHISPSLRNLEGEFQVHPAWAEFLLMFSDSHVFFPGLVSTNICEHEQLSRSSDNKTAKNVCCDVITAPAKHLFALLTPHRALCSFSFRKRFGLNMPCVPSGGNQNAGSTIPERWPRRLNINLCYVTIENPFKMSHIEPRLNWNHQRYTQ